MKPTLHRQQGSSLIEVLVAILILSFGMLSLGGMLAYAVQLPKLAAYRSTAMAIAASHVERMRANAPGFDLDAYLQASTYNQILPSVTPCVHPACTPNTLATADTAETNAILRRELPFNNAGMMVTCAGTCATAREGEMWVMWQEPTTFASISGSASDECPSTVTFTSPARCVHIKFRL